MGGQLARVQQRQKAAKPDEAWSSTPRCPELWALAEEQELRDPNDLQLSGRRFANSAAPPQKDVTFLRAA